ncbi:MAG: hypothetical protein E3K32_06435 [wastewater metagenome]|nr:hypothetical protein [Candidatus Loosdrechtia aerotolerans]
MTLIETFLNVCKKYAKKTAVVDQNGSATYEDIYQEAVHYAMFLLSKDVGRHIGLLLPNSKEFVVLFFGILMAGKIPVPLNYLFSPPQLSYVIKNAEINAILTHSAFKPQVENQVRYIFTIDKEVSYPAIEEKKIERGDEEGLAAILYTSGTDIANPKGVLLTHRNFLSNLDGCTSAFKFSEEDKVLGILPLFHTYPLTTTLMLPIRMGATVVYLARFSAVKTFEAIEKHKITLMAAIPSLYRVLLKSKRLTEYNLNTLRICTSGGERLPSDVLTEFNKAFPVPLMEGYGLTEATAVVSVNTPEKYRPGSIGLPLGNVEVKIVDDAGQSQSVNKEGEIWVKGQNVMKGYYKLPQETAETITSDNWLKTGDYGKLCQDRFLWFTGRKKDLIIISGENVSPHEIERVISGFEKVNEVTVVGISDRIRGEVPKAFIVLYEDTTCNQEEIRDYCSQHLPHYKIPKYIEFVKELPRGPTGKILKRELLR